MANDDVAAGPGGATAVLCALRFLARKSASDGVEVAGDDDIRLGLPGSGEAAARITLGRAQWQHMVARCWVRQADAAGSWRITDHGRRQLRQCLSEAGTPPDTENAPAAERGDTGSKRAPRRSPVSPAPVENPNESPIAWLASRRDRHGQPLIAPQQLKAADRLRADFWYGGLSPRVTTNWAFDGGGRAGACNAAADLSDAALGARERFSRALDAVGPEFVSILTDVCCHGIGLEHVERRAGWPARSAKVVLDLALTRLARHYGYVAPAHAEGPAAVRHWGADGYRPSELLARS